MKISKIAKLSVKELQDKVSGLIDTSKQFNNIIDALLLSMLEIDETAFIKVFNESWQDYGFENSVESILFPFLERIGILWQTGTIDPAQEHFISNLLRQKIIASIDKEMSETAPNKDKIIFFLPENELHEMGLLFYSFIARKKGFDVVYLGASVPLDDLKRVQSVTNANAFFSAYVTARDKEELQMMFNHFRETFPNLPFYVTGLQIKEQKPTLPDNFFAISSSKSFKKALQQLNKSN